jgi:hypothetical protein
LGHFCVEKWRICRLIRHFSPCPEFKGDEFDKFESPEPLSLPRGRRADKACLVPTDTMSTAYHGLRGKTEHMFRFCSDFEGNLTLRSVLRGLGQRKNLNPQPLHKGTSCGRSPFATLAGWERYVTRGSRRWRRGVRNLNPLPLLLPRRWIVGKVDGRGGHVAGEGESGTSSPDLSSRVGARHLIPQPLLLPRRLDVGSSGVME